MDEATKQALDNAGKIIKSVIEMTEPASGISALLSLDGFTATRKMRIETALNLVNIGRSELLRATYPNDDIFGNLK